MYCSPLSELLYYVIVHYAIAKIAGLSSGPFELHFYSAEIEVALWETKIPPARPINGRFLAGNYHSTIFTRYEASSFLACSVSAPSCCILYSIPDAGNVKITLPPSSFTSLNLNCRRSCRIDNMNLKNLSNSSLLNRWGSNQKVGN